MKKKNPEMTSFSPTLGKLTDAEFKKYWDKHGFDGDYKHYHASIKAGKCDYVKAPQPK